MNNRQQRGFIGSWAFIILMAGLAFVFYMIEQDRKDESINRLRTNAPDLSADQMKLIDDYRAKPSPVQTLSGMYRGIIEGERDSLGVSYYFGSGNTLTKTLEASDYEFKGTANYTIQGSALVYTDIEGDKILFSKHGEAFSVRGNKLIFPAVEYPFELAMDIKD